VGREVEDNGRDDESDANGLRVEYDIGCNFMMSMYSSKLIHDVPNFEKSGCLGKLRNIMAIPMDAAHRRPIP
jgi:hypothetical protein